VSERPVRFVVSVLTPDRVGIIAAVSDAVYEIGGNLEALSQTIMHGWFTMIFSVSFPDGTALTKVKRSIEDAGSFHVLVRPADEAQAATPAEGEPFVVTAVGADKPGIVKRLAHCFSDRGVNIEDVWNEVQGSQFIVIFKVAVPSSVDPGEMRHELEQAAADLGISVRFQHQDLFTATSSLSVHTSKKQPTVTDRS